MIGHVFYDVALLKNSVSCTVYHCPNACNPPLLHVLRNLASRHRFCSIALRERTGLSSLTRFTRLSGAGQCRGIILIAPRLEWKAVYVNLILLATA